MMAGKSSGPGIFSNWPAIAAVLVLGAYFFNTVNLPFLGSRPAASGNMQRSLADTQDVDARLWQDPFGPVLKDVENQKKAGTQSGCHNGPSCLGIAQQGNTLILGVMLPGSAYSEDEEQRRQIRYAVLSALGTQAYGPLDSEHIGYFRFHPASGLPARGASCPARAIGATNIAYEEFVPLSSKETINRLFVLWLNEDDLVTVTKSCPLWGLTSLQKAVQRLSSDAIIRFLGPATSNTLQRMIAEARPVATCQPNSGQNKQTYLTLYNFFATANEQELQTANCQNQPIGDFFRTAGIAYYRTITDTVASRRL
jgi:hypothetical protein